MEVVVDCGGLPHVTTMLMSSHIRMLNEAIIALTVLASSLTEDVIHAQLHTDLVINGIKNALNAEESAMPVEMKLNSLTLTLALCKSKPEEFIQMLRDMEFKECLDGLEEQLGNFQQYRDVAGKFSAE